MVKKSKNLKKSQQITFLNVFSSFIFYLPPPPKKNMLSSEFSNIITVSSTSDQNKYFKVYLKILFTDLVKIWYGQ